jgi:tellurite resistance protein
MSLLKRLLGIGSQPARDEPESLRRIAAEFETVPPEKARYLAGFAYALARVARADLEVDADELRSMERTLVEIGELPETDARLATQIAVDQAINTGGTHDYLVTRELRRMTEKPTRVRIMRCVLAVAASDDTISAAESREVVAIGEELGFSRQEISALRYEYREKLAELKPQT